MNMQPASVPRPDPSPNLTQAPPMTSRFQDKLKAIRDASSRQSVLDLQMRSDEDLSRSEKTVLGFEYREQVEAVIEEFVKNFQQEAPEFTLNRGFFEGKYMLALRCTGEAQQDSGKTERHFSRIMFLMSPQPEDARFGLQCRKTIRNRDRDSAGTVADMTAEGLTTLGEFVEAQFLDFAAGYFGHASPSSSEPTPV